MKTVFIFLLFLSAGFSAFGSECCSSSDAKAQESPEILTFSVPQEQFIAHINSIIDALRRYPKLATSLATQLGILGVKPHVEQLNADAPVVDFIVSPDGTHLAFATGTPSIKPTHRDHLFICNTAHPEQQTHVAGPVGTFQFSLEGTHLAFEDYNELFICEFAHPEQQTRVAGDVQHYGFSPNGFHLAFVTQDEDDTDDEPRFNVYVCETAHPEEQTLIDVDVSPHFKFSSDGAHLAFITGHDYGSQLFICESAHPEKQTPIADHVRSPLFSLDGTHLAFTRYSDNGSQLFVCEIAHPEQQTLIADHVQRYGFLPDGTHSVFTTMGHQLFVCETAHPERQTLIADNVGCNLKFSSNGTLFTQRDNVILKIDLTGGLDLIQQLLAWYCLSNEKAGHPVSFTDTQIKKIQEDFYSPHLPLPITTCSICAENLDAHHGEIVGLACNHELPDHITHPEYVHRACIEPWLTTHHTCHLCRYENPILIPVAAEQIAAQEKTALQKEYRAQRELHESLFDGMPEELRAHIHIAPTEPQITASTQQS